jgi:hypothetical protein|uniref:YARHG domain-containing protein n=1 Tax=Shewanella sp. 33B TaxID=592146 RepID=B9W0T1_9GAMM|nr:hypothetical protein [Shewanella sp. 33B]ACM47538.1 hypothetical protein [Shewanella sp. 33B]
MYKAILYCSLLISFNVLAGWDLSRDVNDFDDEKVFTAYSQTNNKSIYVRCKNNELDIIVSYGEYLSNKSVDSKWRFDKEKTSEELTSVSTDGTSIFIRKDKVNEVARGLATYSTVLFASKDYRGTEKIAKFSLKDSSKAIKPVMELCNIPYEPLTYSGMDSEVVSYLDFTSAKELKCDSVRLNALGYNHDFEDKKSFYEAANKYIENEVKKCPKDKSGANFPRWLNCKDKADLFYYLYKDSREIKSVLNVGC